MSASQNKNVLVGIGLDNKDGHKRITTGEGFAIHGGSAETHERFQHVAIKVTEDLARKGKTISTADPQQLNELLHKHHQK